MTTSDIIKRLERIEKLTLLSAKNVLTLEDTAMLTGYTVKYLRQLIAGHEIPFYKRGNRLFFSREDVESWMMSYRTPSDDELRTKAFTK